MFETGSIWGFTGSTMTSLMFFWAMYNQVHIEKYIYKLMGWVSNSVHIKFNEYSGEGLEKSEAFDTIHNYLSTKSTALGNRLKANESKKSKSLVLSLDDHETVEDVFQGVKVKWSSSVRENQNQSSTNRDKGFAERRYLTLSFHSRHREMITTTYLDHVLREGKEIGLKKRERKLYTNNSSHEWISWRLGTNWSNVSFDHPATLETFAMDPEKNKAEKEAWKKRRRKRGRLLRKKRRTKQRRKLGRRRRKQRMQRRRN
ncbi:putative AAA-type ATPase domain-containing protein [Arabidopsis thaliana]|uniref:AAA-type ATPase N-terminal domain-containing protein n=2 Tax=Arabidopsis TaxID=3701 RepID=A0A178VMG9_ARATH|nr:AAA-type ATPase N-terminal domain [Arabidopsis thaliana x Arabidopsis arenosa]OAP07046.1 hypothetical protein AXX17_AT3G31210 [Arabidopsis thaliana]